MFAIQAIPLQDAIQGIEERLVIDQASSIFDHLLVVVESVEGAHGEAAEREFRQIDGQGKLRLGQGRERSGIFIMLTLHEDAAGKVAAPGDAINPGHRIFLVRAGLRERDELLQPDEPGGSIADAAGNDWPQLQLGPDDQPGQPHAADGRGVPLGIFGWAAHYRCAVGAHQLEALGVQAEGTGDVVVLAVNVVGNRSTHGYVFGARAHGQKPPAGHGEIKDLRQRYAGFATQHAGSGIERR